MIPSCNGASRCQFVLGAAVWITPCFTAAFIPFTNPRDPMKRSLELFKASTYIWKPGCDAGGVGGRHGVNMLLWWYQTRV